MPISSIPDAFHEVIRQIESTYKARPIAGYQDRNSKSSRRKERFTIFEPLLVLVWTFDSRGWTCRGQIHRCSRFLGAEKLATRKLVQLVVAGLNFLEHISAAHARYVRHGDNVVRLDFVSRGLAEIKRGETLDERTKE